MLKTHTSRLSRASRPAIVLASLIALGGTASAKSYGVNLSVDKSAGDFGIDLAAKAGIVADNSDNVCDDMWDPERNRSWRRCSGWTRARRRVRGRKR